MKRNAFFVVSDNLIYSLTTFLTSILVAKSTNTTDFGIYIFLFSIWLFFYFIQRGLINDPLLIFGQKNGYVEILFIFQIVFSFFSASATLFFLWLFSDFPIKVILWFSIFLFFQTAREFFRNYCISKNYLNKLLVNDFLFFVFNGFVLIVLYMENYFELYFVWVVSCVVLLFLVSLDTGFFIKKHLDIFFIIPQIKRIAIVKKILNFSKWNSGSNLSMWGYANIYKYFTAMFFGYELLAGVGACQNLMNIFNPVLNGVQNYSLSHMSRMKKNDRHFFEKKLFWTLIVITGLGSAFIIVFSKLLLRFIYGDSYEVFSILLMMFAINLFLSGIGRFYVIYLLSIKQSYSLFKVYLFSLPISIVMLLAVFYLFSDDGLYIYIVFSAVIFLVSSGFYGRKAMREG